MNRRRAFITLLKKGSGASDTTYSISGTVYDADGSTPVEGATVALGELTAESGADGTYTIANVPPETSGSMTCTKGGYNWEDITVAAMSENLTAQNYTANNYAAILAKVYGASEVYPLVDIASGTNILAYVNSARNGTLTGWALQNTAGPITNTLAPYSDGVESGSGSDVGNIDSVSFRSIFNGAIGSMVCFGKLYDASVWSDGADREIINIKADNNNWLRFYKQVTNNTIRAWISIGGVTKTITVGSISTTDWFQLALTWQDSANGNAAKLFLNGSQIGTTQMGFGAWSGTPTISLLGALNSSGGEVWNGWMAHAAFKFGSIWSQTDISNIYAARTGAGPENP
jgi:hypothetical protein